MPDLEVCRDKGALGARCNHTNVDRPRELSHDEWGGERFGQFCMTEESFAKNQKFVEQACALVKNCDIEELKSSYRQLVRTLK